MSKKRELFVIIAAALIMTLVICFINSAWNPELFPAALGISLIIISISVLAKHATASYIDVSISSKIIELKRYWITSSSYLERPLPLGLLFPPLLAFLSAGTIKLLVFIQFESKALISKAAKKFGRIRFSDMMEWDDALIVFYSSLAVLAVSIISSFLKIDFFSSLSFYSWLYALCNLIPLGKTDGSRLFFGSRPLFIFTWVLIGLTSLFVFI